MKKYIKIIKKRENLVSSAPDYFVEQLENIQNSIWRKLQLTIKGMDVNGANLEASRMNIAMANSLRTQVRKWMRDNGYYEQVTKFGEKYESLISHSKQYYKEMGFDPAFFDRDLKTLANIRKEDLNFLMAKDNDVINTVYNEVINSVYTKTDWRTLSKRLENIVTDTVVGGKKLNGLLKKYSATYAQTAFAAFDRKVQNIKANQYEIEQFLYSGSLIVDSREFCATRVGKVFTRKEIESWSSLSWKGKASGRDIWTYLGGWNCRHILTPVSEEMADYIRNGMKTAPPKVPNTPPVKKTVGKFVKAKDIKSAEKWAVDNLGVKKANYKKLGIDLANKTNEQLLNLMSKYDIKLDEIQSVKRSSGKYKYVPAFHSSSYTDYQVKARKLYINIASLEEMGLNSGNLDNSIAMANKRGYWIPERYEDLITHEIGHNLTSPDVFDRSVAISLKYTHINVSKYGRTEGDEALAEIFTLFNTKGKSALKDEWIEFFNKYSRSKIK